MLSRSAPCICCVHLCTSPRVQLDWVVPRILTLWPLWEIVVCAAHRWKPLTISMGKRGIPWMFCVCVSELHMELRGNSGDMNKQIWEYWTNHRDVYLAANCRYGGHNLRLCKQLLTVHVKLWNTGGVSKEENCMYYQACLGLRQVVSLNKYQCNTHIHIMVITIVSTV